ncbi:MULTISPECIES: AraC family transcriptional regulator [Catenuloplanes]|uniref:AraC-like DNA-binding protein n=1 Tax=Catenuloplanes niger TaxID=587534 RepID=A0AAE4CXP2_9ACTN|nr:AraC family transcriptional regulator [Catenuloplanes niger]MDR7325034.1 AraC-like DNA-binding protein [Catenuloplanes niger]
MDVVTDVLQVSGVRGSLGARMEAGGHWAVGIDEPGSALHAVTAGDAWLIRDGHPPVRLAAGDVVLVASRVPHVLADSPDTRGGGCDRAATAQSQRTGEPLRVGTAPGDVRIVTIVYDCDHTVRTQLLFALPELVHVPAGSECDDTVRMLGRELSRPQIATTAVLNSLVDIMLIQLLRAWLPTRAAAHRGSWFGMLGDPVVRRALEHIHADPARDWTTGTLAAATAVSRATLSRRFPAAIGQSPGTYLTQWRMDLAAARLHATDQSVEAIAAGVGYHSVPAFSRAFTRAHGTAPGRYRAAARG